MYADVHRVSEGHNVNGNLESDSGHESHLQTVKYRWGIDARHPALCGEPYMTLVDMPRPWWWQSQE